MNTITIPARDLKPGDTFIHPLGGKARVATVDISSSFYPGFPDDICLQVDRTAFGKTLRIAYSFRDGDKIDIISLNGTTPEHLSGEEVSGQQLFWDWASSFPSENGQKLLWEWFNG